MTKVVKGAGRARAAGNRRHNEQEKKPVGVPRTDAIKRAASGEKPPRRKAAEPKAEPKPAKKAAPTGQTWDKGATLGSNVDRLKTAGVTWRGIAEMATASGDHDIPYPDGGKLLRARNQFLKGTEGKEQVRRAPRRKATANVDEDGEKRSLEEQIAFLLTTRSVPWDDETSDEDVITMVDGKRLTYFNRLTGKEHTTKVLRNGKHLEVKEGKEGRYISFVSEEGPFQAVGLGRILKVS